MPTLNIEGKRVTVDDSFLNLSPEDQAKTVDEIAAQIGVTPQPEQQSPPQVGRHLTFEEGQALLNKEEQSGVQGTINSFGSGFAEGIPIVGPAVLGGIKRAGAGIASMIDGESYATNMRQGEQILGDATEQHPGANLAGNLTSGVGSMIPLGATGIGARALGIAGPSLGSRVVASGLSSAAISAADTTARGGDPAQIAGNTAISGGIGVAVPIVGAGVNAALRGIGNKVGPAISAITNPAQEANRRVGVAVTRDAAGNPGGVLSAADEAVAQNANIPLVNADRGGEVTRALARSAANQSPEARAGIDKVASDRFGAQGQRATDFLKKVTNGNVDDLALQENIKLAAKAANKPAYDVAFKAPQAQAVFTPRIQQLMQSPSFRSAIDSVPARSADRGAVQGFKEIGNPFTKNSQGAYVLRRAADGTTVTPNLQFWNQVKINLDEQIGIAKRAGNNTLTSDLTGLKKALVDDIDAVVPAYKTARQGAAGFFGAEDSIEAGRIFAKSPRSIPEARKAYAKFTAPEREGFATGYASELIDRIKTVGDRTNVINSIFKNQSTRESLELALGPQRAKDIEAYVRVEDLADRLRGAMGNSTTARQLVELGIGAGGGFALSGGDWKGALSGALALKGARYLGERADAKVMENVAKLLTSDNPGNLKIAVAQAAKNPAYMKALENLSNALGAPVRGAALAIGNQ
jgi:hypothetical protein